MSSERLIIYEGFADSRQLMSYRDRINRLGKDFARTVFPHDSQSLSENLFDRLDEYDMVVFAEDRGEIVGFATLSQRPGMDEWELVTAFVDKSHRRRGIWGNMTTRLEEKARLRGARSLLALPILGNDFLIESLERNGFERVQGEREMRKFL